MKKCKECNREYEDPQTVGDFFGICDECYKEEYKKNRIQQIYNASSS